MEEQEPPLRYIVPGRVYRNEASRFKSYNLFHQVEGLYVDKNVSFADLKGILTYFVKRLFGAEYTNEVPSQFFSFY